MRFQFVVTVDAETEHQAEIVMRERLDCDEEYGFDYEIEWGQAEPLLWEGGQ